MNKLVIGLFIGLVGAAIFTLGDLIIPTLISLKINDYQQKIAEAQKRNSFNTAVLIISKIEDQVPNDLAATKTEPPPITKYDYDDDAILLGRFLPIKVIVEKYTAYYNIDTLWYCQTLFEESNLDPIAFNSTTKDYGISQEKKATFEEARAIALDKTNVYCFNSDLPDNIYNPESNIITSLIFVKSKLINEFRIPEENKNLLSAVYNLGYNAITPNGKLSNDSINYISLVEARKIIVKRILQYFKSERSLIQNKRIKELLDLYNPNLNTQQMYHVVFTYYLSKLTDDAKPWEGTIALSESLNYFRILDKGYNEKNENDFEEIYHFYLRFKTKMNKIQDQNLIDFFAYISNQIELAKGNQ